MLCSQNKLTYLHIKPKIYDYYFFIFVYLIFNLKFTTSRSHGKDKQQPTYHPKDLCFHGRALIFSFSQYPYL